MSFNTDATNYHHGRPPYPARVYGLLADRYGLGPGVRVLEVGAGTGTATAELLARGAQVTAIEPGPDLAGLLRAQHRDPALSVVQADLEQVELAGHCFDLAVAATSWHWVDGALAVPKVAAALRPGGALVVWWTVFADPQQPHTSFRDALESLYRRFLPHEPDESGRPPLPMRVPYWREQLGLGGWFDPPAVEVIRWNQPLTPDTARALWATFPNIAELADLDREAFLTGVADAVTGLGGLVHDPRVTIVYGAVVRHPSL
jgi:SAM-dependent methyltransferase